MKTYYNYAIGIICFLTLFVSCEKDDIVNTGIIAPSPIPVDTTTLPMHIYFGNLHAHTHYSDGSGSPADGYQWARDVAKMDFYAITDHAELLDSYEWLDIGNQAKNFTQDGTFVGMRGFEWSSVIDGHANIFNTDNFISSILYPTASSLYTWLYKKTAYAQFNHPGWEGQSFDNLNFDKNTVPNFMSVETGNDNQGNNTNIYLQYYDTALDNGWEVGPTNNLDNHTLVDNKHRTAILAKELTQKSILDAFAARRFYSTDDPDIKIKFKYKDNWMGAFVKDTGNIVFNIEVQDNEPISKIELITNKGVVADYVLINIFTTFTWNPFVHVSGQAYYYIKVTSQNTLESDLAEQIAVTAPIWFNYK